MIWRYRAITLLVFLLSPMSLGSIVGQETWTSPRTSDGHPDLGGIWANNSATPMERPEQLADKVSLTDEELADLNIVQNDEMAGVRKTLDAAAWTYVAAFIASLGTLLYLLSIARR